MNSLEKGKLHREIIDYVDTHSDRPYNPHKFMIFDGAGLTLLVSTGTLGSYILPIGCHLSDSKHDIINVLGVIDTFLEQIKLGNTGDLKKITLTFA